MARFASGRKTYGISDRSGFRYRLSEVRKEWNGLLVGPDEYEPKHSQLPPPETSLIHKLLETHVHNKSFLLSKKWVSLNILLSRMFL